MCYLLDRFSEAFKNVNPKIRLAIAPITNILGQVCMLLYLAFSIYKFSESDKVSIFLVFFIVCIFIFWIILLICNSYQVYKITRRVSSNLSKQSLYLSEAIKKASEVCIFIPEPENWDECFWDCLSGKRGAIFVNSIESVKNKNIINRDDLKVYELRNSGFYHFLKDHQFSSRFIILDPCIISDVSVFSWLNQKQDGRIVNFCDKMVEHPLVSLTYDFQKVLCRITELVEEIEQPKGYWISTVKPISSGRGKNHVKGQKSVVRIFISDNGHLVYEGYGLSEDDGHLAFWWRSTIVGYSRYDNESRLIFYTDSENIFIWNENLAREPGVNIINLGQIKFHPQNNTTLCSGDGRFFDLSPNNETKKSAALHLKKICEQAIISQAKSLFEQECSDDEKNNILKEILS